MIILSNKFFKILLYGLLIFFIYLMILITLQYIPINFNAAFLRLKVDEIKLRHYQIAFFVHVYSSIVVLLSVMFQL